MNYCLLCDDEIVVETSWLNIFLPSKHKKICTECEEKLLFIPEERCGICSRAYNDRVCKDCQRWKKHFNNKDPLTYNVSLFQYNDFFQETIANWKYRGDYIIIEAFSELFLKHFQKSFSNIDHPLIVSIPLSEERAKERGFNQASQLASFLPGEKCNLFLRISSEKQAKKSRTERIYGENPFKLIKKVNSPVILVDDIYTTGSTLRQAAALLKENNCPKVYSYTLIRG